MRKFRTRTWLAASAAAATALGVAAVSAWEGPKCDAYIPAWGRNARPVGGKVTTTVGTTTSNAYRDGSTWHVVVPQP